MKGAGSAAVAAGRREGDAGDVVIDGVALVLSPMCAVLVDDYMAGQVPPVVVKSGVVKTGSGRIWAALVLSLMCAVLVDDYMAGQVPPSRSGCGQIGSGQNRWWSKPVSPAPREHDPRRAGRAGPGRRRRAGGEHDLFDGHRALPRGGGGHRRPGAPRRAAPMMSNGNLKAARMARGGALPTHTLALLISHNGAAPIMARIGGLGLQGGHSAWGCNGPWRPRSGRIPV